MTKLAQIVAGFETWGWVMVHRPVPPQGPVRIGTTSKDIFTNFL